MHLFLKRTACHTEQAIVQAIRSHVGVGSLKEKQIEAIFLHQDTFICACPAEDYCQQYCGYGYILLSFALSMSAVACTGDGLRRHFPWPNAFYHSERRCASAMCFLHPRSHSSCRATIPQTLSLAFPPPKVKVKNIIIPQT